MVDKIERNYVSGVLIETPYDEDGEINGIQKKYYKSGELRYEIPYIDGVENGIKKEYYESGELKYETPMIDDKKNGVHKLYYETGKLKQESIYKDGKLNGVVKLYYESGELKEELLYKDGELNDVSKWCKTGDLIEKAIYKDGKQTGGFKWKDAKLEQDELKEDRVIKWYYETGELKEEVSYKYGKKNGVYKLYYKTGKLREEGLHKYDKLNGVYKWYYKSGGLEKEVSYKDGKINGIEKKYYQSGELKCKRTYNKKEYSESNQLKDEIPLENEENEFSQEQYYSGVNSFDGCLPALISNISIIGSCGIFVFLIYEFNLSEWLIFGAFPASLGIGMFISSLFEFDGNPIKSGMSGIWFGFLWIIGGLVFGYLLKIGIPILFATLEILKDPVIR